MNKPPCGSLYEDVETIQSCQICCNQKSPKFLAVNMMEGIAFIVHGAKQCEDALKAAKELWPTKDVYLSKHIISAVLSPEKPASHPLWPMPPK